MTTTIADIAAQNQTSPFVNVKIEVEPNNVLQTSPDKFAAVEKRFIIKQPIASAPTEIIAIMASPLIFVFCPVRSSSTALTIVIPIIRGIFSVIFNTVAIVIAPNATWERPSPMNEKRLSTRVTPRSEEHRAISTPTTSAQRTNGYCQ